MLGFKSVGSARVILGGIEIIQGMRKQDANYACNRQPSLAERVTFSLHERGRTYQLFSCPSARRAADSYDIPFCFSVTSPSIQRFDHPPINPNSLLFASRT
jgi:hypothetical protein